MVISSLLLLSLTARRVFMQGTTMKIQAPLGTTVMLSYEPFYDYDGFFRLFTAARELVKKIMSICDLSFYRDNTQWIGTSSHMQSTLVRELCNGANRDSESVHKNAKVFFADLVVLILSAHLKVLGKRSVTSR